MEIIDVRALPADSAFLLDDGTTAILYDSGFGFTGNAVAEKIKKHLGDRPLDYIFLTHSHYDHALGSAHILQYWPNAVVAASDYAAEVFKRPGAKRVMRELDRKYAAAQGVTDYPDRTEELRVDLPLKDGDRIQTGAMEWTAISLPGHTRCSMAFYLEKEQLLLSCETLGVYDGEKTVLPSFLVGYQMTLDSIQKAKKLKIRQYLLPHYGLLDPALTDFYLENSIENTVTIAKELREILYRGGTEEEALAFFKDKYYTKTVSKISPIDAMNLNTSIMIRLLMAEEASE